MLRETIDRELVERDRDPRVEFLDPLLLRGIVVTRGREVRLRLDEEVKALSLCREGVRELTSPREAVLALEELVATLLREVPGRVDVT